MPSKSRNSFSEKVGVIGVPFSKGQPRGGTEFGPRTLRDAGIVQRLEGLGCQVNDHGDVDVGMVENDLPENNVKNPRTVGRASRKIAEKVESVLKSDGTCLALGGDHSMAIGTIYGHAQVHPDLCVLWIDAHADINTPLTSESGNIHGMPMSFLVKELESYVPRLPGFEWLYPCISARNIAYIGLRDVDKGERFTSPPSEANSPFGYYNRTCVIRHADRDTMCRIGQDIGIQRKIIEEFGITSFSMQEVDKYGIKDVVDRALQAIDPSGNRSIHLSFDVDSMDPTLIPSTGTPVVGGLSFRESAYIAEEVSATGRLSVVDVAEVNPHLGTEKDVKLTADMTIEVVQRFFGSRRQGIYPPGYDIPLPVHNVESR